MKHTAQPILGALLFIIGICLLIGNIKHETPCQWAGIMMSVVVMVAGIRLCRSTDSGIPL